MALRRVFLPPKFRNDMVHIALATVADADVVPAGISDISFASTRFGSSTPSTSKRGTSQSPFIHLEKLRQMIAQPSSTSAPDADSDFHAVSWVRGVRDQMYAATATLSAAELVQFVREAARGASQRPDNQSADRRTA